MDQHPPEPGRMGSSLCHSRPGVGRVKSLSVPISETVAPHLRIVLEKICGSFWAETVENVEKDQKTGAILGAFSSFGGSVVLLYKTG